MANYVHEQALAGDFSNIGRVHDWRNHIGQKLIELWPTFTNEQKIAIAEDADSRASDENWE